MSGSRLHRPPMLARSADRAARSSAADVRGNVIQARIRQAVREIEPDAEIILYGSRARGDAEADADWDLLVLIDGEVDLDRKKAVWDRLYELELRLEEVLSPLVVSHQDWDTPLYRAMPFHDNVDRDGIVL